MKLYRKASLEMYEFLILIMKAAFPKKPIAERHITSRILNNIYITVHVNGDCL